MYHSIEENQNFIDDLTRKLIFFEMTNVLTLQHFSIPIQIGLDKPISNLKTPVDSSVNEVYFRHSIYPNLSSLDFYIYI